MHKIKLFLNEKLKCAEEIKGEKQSQDTPQAKKTKSKKEWNIVQEKNIQDKQIVPIRGSFGCYVTNSRKQVTRVPVVVAATYDNFVWFMPFHLLNFFSTVQFFFQQPPKLSRKQRALAYQSPKETNQTR